MLVRIHTRAVGLLLLRPTRTTAEFRAITAQRGVSDTLNDVHLWPCITRPGFPRRHGSGSRPRHAFSAPASAQASASELPRMHVTAPANKCASRALVRSRRGSGRALLQAASPDEGGFPPPPPRSFLFFPVSSESLFWRALPVSTGSFRSSPATPIV